MSLPLFLLIAAGIQYGIGGAAITQPLRDPLPQILRTLLECTACSGFWIGIVLQASGIGPFDGSPGALRLLGGGLVGMAGVPVVRFFGPDGGRRGDAPAKE